MKRRNLLKGFFAALGIASASVAAPVMASASSVNDQAEGLDVLIEIQTREACHDHNPYMVGLANGLILARSALFGSEVKFVDAPKEWKNKNENPFEQLRNQLRDDPDYAWGWHCNIAVASMDEGMDHAAANRAAARVMYSAFGVDTSSREACLKAAWNN